LRGLGPRAVDEDRKQLPFAEAETGATGLELLLPLALKWGAEKSCRSPRPLRGLTSEPARILGVASGNGIEAGAPAYLVLFDPAEHWRVLPRRTAQPGQEHAFLATSWRALRATIVAGSVVYEGPK